MFRAATDADPNRQVMDSWKSFNIADVVNFIKAIKDELKVETVNTCWKNLLREDVNDFKGFPGIDREVKKIIQTATYIRGEGLVDMIDGVEEHIEDH